MEVDKLEKQRRKSENVTGKYWKLFCRKTLSNAHYMPYSEPTI